MSQYARTHPEEFASPETERTPTTPAAEVKRWTCKSSGRAGGLKGGLKTGPTKARTSEQARKAALTRWAKSRDGAAVVKAAFLQVELHRPPAD